MANGFLSYVNRVDSATLSGGDWETDLPLTYLQNRRQTKVARSASADADDTVIIMDYGQSVYNQVIAAIATNLENDGEFRWDCSDDSGFSSVNADTGWLDVYDAIYASSELEFEDDNWWTGKPSETDLNAYRRNLIYSSDSFFTGRYHRLRLRNTGNAAGYLDIGRLWNGPIWRFDVNFTNGSSYTFDPRSAVEEAPSGAEFFDVRGSKRGVSLSLDFLSKAEAFSRVHDMNTKIGITGEVLVVPDDEDNENMFRQSFLGRLTRLAPIPHKESGLYTTKIEAQELGANGQ